MPSRHDQRLNESYGTALNWWFCLEVDWVAPNRKFCSIGFFQCRKHDCKASHIKAINGGRTSAISVILKDVF